MHYLVKNPASADASTLFLYDPFNIILPPTPRFTWSGPLQYSLLNLWTVFNTDA